MHEPHGKSGDREGRVLIIGPRGCRERLRSRGEAPPRGPVELDSVYSGGFEASLCEGPYDEIHYFALRAGEFEAAAAWLAAACRADGFVALYRPDADPAVVTDLAETRLAAILADARLAIIVGDRWNDWHGLRLVASP